MKEKIKKTFLAGRKKKRRNSNFSATKNISLIHYSPILTINVSQKERIKILKQKKVWPSLAFSCLRRNELQENKKVPRLFSENHFADTRLVDAVKNQWPVL